MNGIKTPLLSLLVLLWLPIASQANVVGTDLQNFNPTTSGLDFVTVHSSETLEPGIINTGLFLNWAVNTLPRFSDPGLTNRGKLQDSLFSADLHLGIGLVDNWDAGIAFPFVLAQSLDQQVDMLRFSRKGNNEIKLNTKYRFFGDRSGGLAVIVSANFNNIKNNPYTGPGAGPTLNLEGAYDFTYRKVAIGFNIGHRWRSPGDQNPGFPVEPFKNSFIWSAAASYLFTSIDTKFITEIYGSFPTQDLNAQPKRSQSSAELLMGLKHDFTTNLAGHAGAGTELLQGAASPDFRLYTGINYAFGPVWGSRYDQAKLRFGKVKPFKKVTIPDILFAFDSDEVRLDKYRRTFELLVQYLKTPPAYTKLEIDGHTDSVGRAAYNMDLSRRRAANIRKVLVNTFKLKKDKVIARGFGESRPIADNGNYQGRQKNRRVEFKIYRN